MRERTPPASDTGHRTHADSSDGPAGGEVWRLPDAAGFERSDWNEEVVVFNHASGQTHLLDALSNRVLSAFEEQPWQLSDLAKALAAELAIPPSVMTDRLRDISSQFERLGLLDADPA